MELFGGTVFADDTIVKVTIHVRRCPHGQHGQHAKRPVPGSCNAGHGALSIRRPSERTMSTTDRRRVSRLIT
ncbi:hypothetical protein GCM10010377_70810 [Streptomyces viridiviolaceus]|nr:hypothetical protein GCM10010377_70810 [Streptomyces viridiviolaceus]